MPDDGVLRTKLARPERNSRAVDRRQALDRIDSAMAGPGTAVLVSVGGYGRLELLSRWAEDRTEDPTIWLRLDQWDDIGRLLRHLVAALRQIDPEVGAGALAVADDGDEAIRDVALPSLASDVEAMPTFTMVFDGVHRVLDPVTQVGVRAINRYRPANMRVLFTANDDAVADFRSADGLGRVPRLDEEDLRFSDDEMSEILVAAGFAPLPSELDRFSGSTDGWPLAVLHAVEASVAAGRVVPFDPADPDIAPALHRFICGSMPADLRTIASDLAVVGSTTVGHFEAVTDRSDSAGSLDVLRQLHLVTVDHGRVALVHGASGHLLHERADQDPTGVTLLRRRMARMLAEKGEPAAALELLDEAGDGSAHSRLLLERHRQWSAARVVDVAHHAERALLRDPGLVELHLVRAWHAVFSDDDRAARAIVDGARSHPVTGARQVRMRSELEMLESVLARRQGRMDDSMFHAIACEELAATISREAALEMSTTPYTAVAPATLSLYLGYALFHAGEIEDARAELLRANLERQWSPPALAAMHGALGMIGWLEDDISASTHAAIAAANLPDEITSSNHLAAAAFALLNSGDDADDVAARYADAVEVIREPTAAVVGHLINAVRAQSSAEARRAHTSARTAVERCAQPGILSLLVARAASLLDLPDASPELGEPLTDGELRVVRALRGDLTEREIAGELNLSHNTVRTYRRRAYRKLGVVSRSAAIEALAQIDGPS